MRGLIQASDVELRRGLTEKRILQLQGLHYCQDGQLTLTALTGFLQPLPSDRLLFILSVVLTIIPTHSWASSKVPFDRLTDELLYDHAIEKEISQQVCQWFGDVNDGVWTMDERSVVKEIGLSLLEKHRVRLKSN